MKDWCGLADRLLMTRRRTYILLGLLFIMLVAFAGCQGGLRHESWPGMTVVDDVIYVANLERVQALNSESGKVYWSFPPESDKDLRPFYATPVLAEDVGPYGVLLIAGYKDRTVYALKLGESPAERPDELWRFDGAGGQFVAGGVLYNKSFIIGNGDGSVYALDIETGDMLWSYLTGDRVWATPVVVGDAVYVASLDHYLYCLDAATGSELWKMEMQGAMAATPVATAGSLWVGDFSSTLYRINLESHTVEWTYSTKDWIWATPVLHDTTMYLVDVGGSLYAINTETDALIWTKLDAIDDIVHGRPAFNEDYSRLFVGGYEQGEIHVINTENGAIVNTWTQKNAGRLPGDLISADGRLYTMPIMISERIQAFDQYSGDLVWPLSED
ncbi:MAG: PQQ-like beta-propeller repeat protein [Anaerolineae bacterium]|nr:PQQ-like beta-propeller repeat protein [Anaerolineae bacterium]